MDDGSNVAAAQRALLEVTAEVLGALSYGERDRILEVRRRVEAKLDEAESAAQRFTAQSRTSDLTWARDLLREQYRDCIADRAVFRAVHRTLTASDFRGPFGPVNERIAAVAEQLAKACEQLAIRIEQALAAGDVDQTDTDASLSLADIKRRLGLGER